MAVAPSRIAQIAVPVQDLERAKRFYGGVLGLEWIGDAPPGLSFFRCGGVRLMLSRPEGAESEAGAMVYYGVEDIRAACAAMRDGGARFDADPHMVGRLGDTEVWLAVCRDGEGNLVGLMSERTAADAQAASASGVS